MEATLTKLGAAITILVIDPGCDKTNHTLPLREGDYAGRFSVRIQDGTFLTGGAAFSIRDFAYCCIPGKAYLPPAGRGTYSVHGTITTLTDNVAHTAEFDWTLLLNGDFDYSFDGKTPTLTQDDTRFHRSRTIKLLLQNG